jgi:endoglucanase
MKRLLTATLATLLVVSGGSAAAAAPSTPSAQIRVDQVGYGTGESKHGYVLAPAPVDGTPYTVNDSHGRAVLKGKISGDLGAWNPTYGHVYRIDFTALRTPGTYTLRAAGAASPRFRVGDTEDLFNPLVRDAVSFFAVQRDGADVDRSLLDRKPSHLADRAATVYEPPVFTGEGGDEIAAPLKAIGGPVDVEGGWFDAGDFVKFTHTTAYSLASLLYVQRGGDLGRLRSETDHGLAWLDKMWDAQHKVLYAQVGIGTGSEQFNFLGDHDVWRLPEADDALRTGPGDPSQYLKYRPVFPAAPAGQPISPNLAGRVSAAFALGAQTALQRGDRKAARHWFDQAASVFAQARTTDVGELVTAYPHAYYPEDSWQDDLEFGATELARAARQLGDPRADRWLRDAAHWARAYLGAGYHSSLNLYDTSALAHTELAKLLQRSKVGGLEVGVPDLERDLARQLSEGWEIARQSPFFNAAAVDEFDVATRSFGYAAAAKLYQSINGSRRYALFGTRQRDFALGANAWGVSLMIGDGAEFAQCPQHQVANLSGSLTGGRKVIRGAVVNGPNGADNFEDLGIPDGARACPAADGENRFAPFDTGDARFLDDVRAWPSVEPALDFTATGALALALTARG